MIEYGLSVSLNTTPRSPVTPRPGIDMEYEHDDVDTLLNAPRKQMRSFADLLSSSSVIMDDFVGENEMSDEHERSFENEHMPPPSISPRVLFTDVVGAGRMVVRHSRSISRSSSEQEPDRGRGIRRQLNFHLAGGTVGDFHSLSPVSFKTNSLSRCDEEPQSIGECGVCYSQLPLRANHVFTLCGHLFCLRCLLKWWDNATTCPICRAEIFDADADAAEEEAAAREAARDDSSTVVDDDQEEIGNDDDENNGNETANEEDDDEVEPNTNNIINRNEGLWMRREFWNDRVDHLIESDEEEEDAANVAHHGREREHVSAVVTTTVAAAGLTATVANENQGAGDFNTSRTEARRTEAHFVNPITRINLYFHQDTQSDWSRHVSPYLDDMELQQSPHPLSDDEIKGLRENREIAMTLFARMRFRETLFHPSTQFMGRIWDGVFVHKNEWIYIMNNMLYPVSNENIMYEFVIRRDSSISPLYEVNLFGFIKNVMIQRIGEYNPGDDYDWEELHEYVFIADVFTPTDFYIYNEWDIPTNAWDIPTNAVQSYGGYHMEEGTITTQELAIPFSQVRRLYLMSAHERSDV